jgi:hypothetical protein
MNLIIVETKRLAPTLPMSSLAGGGPEVCQYGRLREDKRTLSRLEPEDIKRPQKATETAAIP